MFVLAASTVPDGILPTGSRPSDSGPSTHHHGHRLTPPGKEMGGPEFLYKSRLPSIRLKAPARKRQKLLHKSESTGVQVVLLSGQRVEVACDTDSTAGEVFDSVVTHTNLTEHVFFGLTHLQDGEHFFLESEDKLYKTSPPGWRNQKKQTLARNVYTLYLRLKYYPTTLDFIKTEHTLHEIYLQLRRDVVDERLQTERDVAFQLGALALQAEYGDRPSNARDYFHVGLYLPHRHLVEEAGGEERARGVLAEIHAQHYSGMGSLEAETEYLKMAQNQREYGIHFHRLYRSKPSLNLAPTPLGDPETGTPLWIGILPKGVIVFEERAGQRLPISQHPWHTTQTLQFDKKRFLIVPQIGETDGQRPSKKLIFYTDDYKKSSYFVKFAASQHKFCMKMRGWANTIQADPNKESFLSTIPKTPVSSFPGNSLSNKSADSGVPDMGSRDNSPDNSRNAWNERPVPPPRRVNSKSAAEVLDVDEPSKDVSSLNQTGESVSRSLLDRLGEAPGLSPVPMNDYSVFTVRLVKDPRYGLGLTLVDGEIQGLKGVYVKSLTPGGPAELHGRLRIGDKLISVNGVDLKDRNRHDAVSLVRDSKADVEMEILRLRGLSSSSEESVASPNKPASPTTAATPVPRQRAVSDMSNSAGASVTLPPYRSQDIMENLIQEMRADDSRKTRTLPTEDRLAVPPHARQASSLSRSSGPSSSFRGSGRSSRSSGEFRVNPLTDSELSHHGGVPGESELGEAAGTTAGSTSGMYVGLDTDSDEDAMQPSPGISVSDKWRPGSTSQFDSGVAPSEPNTSARPDRDWVENIPSFDSDVEEDDEQMEDVEVTLEKNEKGSLGIKVAGGSKGQDRIYIKALVANPALSCSNLRPGDRLLSVNGSMTTGLAHEDVVMLLKEAASPVGLGLQRPATRSRPDLESLEEVETLTVALEKPLSGSLGLSLARPSGGEGIFIRVISGGSAADEDGRLRVGDRLWSINGISVAFATPLQVVETLKAAEGLVNLVVKREKKNNC